MGRKTIYDKEDVLKFSPDHTIPEIQGRFGFISYGACAQYLRRNGIGYRKMEVRERKNASQKEITLVKIRNELGYTGRQAREILYAVRKEKGLCVDCESPELHKIYNKDGKFIRYSTRCERCREKKIDYDKLRRACDYLVGKEV